MNYIAAALAVAIAIIAVRAVLSHHVRVISSMTDEQLDDEIMAASEWCESDVDMLLAEKEQRQAART